MPRIIHISIAILATLAIAFAADVFTISLPFIGPSVLRFVVVASSVVGILGLFRGSPLGIAFARLSLGTLTFIYAVICTLFVFVAIVGAQVASLAILVPALIIGAVAFALGTVVVKLGHSDVGEWALARSLGDFDDDA
jgi:hypothetical protein